MPVGGDVTSFSIGLLGEFGRAIRAGRIPYWNDLWGYGFPGLAESQMGVYYPPNVILYGLLPVEGAFTTNLVLHALWAGLGAAWASRRFGTSDRGSALSGLAWGTCGFFLAHMTHHWGAVTASWMPWAWGLAWSIAVGTCRPRAALWLAAVVTLQLLPGHFQLAFVTQATTCLVGLCGLAARRSWRPAASAPGGHGRGRPARHGPGRADRRAGRDGRVEHRPEIPGRLCERGDGPGQLRRPGPLPRVATLASARVGRLPRDAGGAPGHDRPRAALPGRDRDLRRAGATRPSGRWSSWRWRPLGSAWACLRARDSLPSVGCPEFAFFRAPSAVGIGRDAGGSPSSPAGGWTGCRRSSESVGRFAGSSSSPRSGWRWWSGCSKPPCWRMSPWPVAPHGRRSRGGWIRRSV